LLPNQAVKNVLRNQKDYQLRNIVAMGSNAGMQTMETALEALFVEGAISDAVRDDVAKAYTMHHVPTE
jgi:Tfp pilus assembly pilus retraction ATPase PilT